MAGKGSKIRPGANLKAYWNNYDAIFRAPKYTPEFEQWYADLQAAKGKVLDKDECLKIYDKEKY